MVGWNYLELYLEKNIIIEDIKSYADKKKMAG